MPKRPRPRALAPLPRERSGPPEPVGFGAGHRPDIPIRTWEPEGVRRSRSRRRVLLTGLTAIALLGFIGPLATFPSITVNVQPKIEERPIPSIELEATPAISAPDATTGRIPAAGLTIESQETRDFQPTGRRYVEERARGAITISNAFSSSPQTLVAGTRFRAPGGEIFRLTRQVLVPGARVESSRIIPSALSAEVVADRPGEAYNLGPSQFRIPGFFGSPKYEGFSAKSSEPFRGGFQGEAMVITARDLASAEEELSRALIERLGRELSAKVPAEPDLVVLDGSRRTTITEISSPKAGERQDPFRVSMTGAGRMVIFRKSHLGEFLRARLLGGDQSAFPTREQPTLSFSAVRLDAGGERLSFSLQGVLRYFHRIPEADLSRTFRQSTLRKIESHLKGREEVASFRVKKFPSWLWFVPQRPGGLEVTVEEPRG